MCLYSYMYTNQEVQHAVPCVHCSPTVSLRSSKSPRPQPQGRLCWLSKSLAPTNRHRCCMHTACTAPHRHHRTQERCMVLLLIALLSKLMCQLLPTTGFKPLATLHERCATQQPWSSAMLRTGGGMDNDRRWHTKSDGGGPVCGGWPSCAQPSPLPRHKARTHTAQRCTATHCVPELHSTKQHLTTVTSQSTHLSLLVTHAFFIIGLLHVLHVPHFGVTVHDFFLRPLPRFFLFPPSSPSPPSSSSSPELSSESSSSSEGGGRLSGYLTSVCARVQDRVQKIIVESGRRWSLQQALTNAGCSLPHLGLRTSCCNASELSQTCV